MQRTDKLRGRLISDLSNLVKVLGGRSISISVYESAVWADSQGPFVEPDLVLPDCGVAKRSLKLSTTTSPDEVTVLYGSLSRVLLIQVVYCTYSELAKQSTDILEIGAGA